MANKHENWIINPPIPIKTTGFTIDEHTDYGKITFIVYKETIDSSVVPIIKHKNLVFQGSVTDCYSYIKLKEGGYFNI